VDTRKYLLKSPAWSAIRGLATGHKRAKSRSVLTGTEAHFVSPQRARHGSDQEDAHSQEKTGARRTKYRGLPIASNIWQTEN